MSDLPDILTFIERAPGNLGNGQEEKMSGLNGCKIYTDQKGEWRVAVLLSSGAVAVTDPQKYSNEASAFLSAKRQHHDKPFLNFVAVRGSK
jgi:hypothetical protein